MLVFGAGDLPELALRLSGEHRGLLGQLQALRRSLGLLLGRLPVSLELLDVRAGGAAPMHRLNLLSRGDLLVRALEEGRLAKGRGAKTGI